MMVRMRIDGIMRNIFTVPKDLQGSVISRLKIMGNMDIAQHRLPQDGRSNIRIRQQDIDIRIEKREQPKRHKFKKKSRVRILLYAYLLLLLSIVAFCLIDIYVFYAG